MSCFCVRVTNILEFYQTASAPRTFSVSPIKGSIDFLSWFHKYPKLLRKPTSNNCLGGPPKRALFVHFFDQKWVLPVTEELQKRIIAWGEVIWDVLGSKITVTWLTCVGRWYVPFGATMPCGCNLVRNVRVIHLLRYKCDIPQIARKKCLLYFSYYF